MIQSTSQSAQTSSPLATSLSKRVVDGTRSSASSPTTSSEEASKAKQKSAEQAQNLSDQRMVSLLRARDQEVRSHEAAHTSAGGSLVVSGPSYTYQKGPDGRSYAIGGEVQLDVSAVANDPEATLEKSQQIRRAALAPADPSSQDLRVASNANQLASRARVDIATLRREEAQLEEQEKALEAEQNNNEAADEVVAGSNSPSNLSNAQGSLEVDLNSASPPTAAINAFMETVASSESKSVSKESEISQFV